MVNFSEIKRFREAGKLIRKAREAQGLSIVDMAKSTGLTISQIASFESGNRFAFQGHDFDRLFNKCLDALEIKVDIKSNQSQISADSNLNSRSKLIIPNFLRKSF